MFKRAVKWLAAIAFISLAVSTFGQGSSYINVALTPATSTPNAQARFVSFANIRVCVEPAVGQVCSPLANIFSDAALTQPLPNPFQADQYGNYSFYAAAGTYHLQITGQGVQQVDLPYQTIGTGQGSVIEVDTTEPIEGGPITTVGAVSCPTCATTSTFASPPPIGNVTPSTGAFTTLSAVDLQAKTWPVVDLRANGLVGDLVTLSNCGMTASSPTLTCVGSAFASTDVGKMVSVAGAGTVGGSNYILNATITAYASATVVTISATASNTVSNQQAWYGTDNYAAMCAITNCTSATLPNRYIDGPNSGQRLYLPYGAYYTSHPFYVRNGQYLQGASEIASAILLFTNTNNAPVVCANGNASGGTDTCTGDSTGTLDIGVSDFYMGAAINGTQPGVQISNASGFFADRLWYQTAVGVYVYASNIGSIRDNVCDAGTGQCVELLGTGQTSGADYETTTHSVIIDGLKSYAPTYACVWVDGADGIQISNMECDYAKQYGVYVYSPEGYTTHRLHIQNSHITGSTSGGYATNTQACFFVNGNAIDTLFEGNTCTHMQSNDILVSDGLTINGFTVKGNAFKDSGLYNGGADIFLGGASGAFTGVTIEGNIHDHPGGAALFSNSPVLLENNRCFHPWTVATAPGTDYSAGCFGFSNTASAGLVAENNTTDSTTVPAVSYNTGGAGRTGGNRSSYTYDVAINNNNSACCSSWNERVENAAGLGLAVFPSYMDYTTGIPSFSGLKIGGTTALDSSRNATLGNVVGANLTGTGVLVMGSGPTTLTNAAGSVDAAKLAAVTGTVPVAASGIGFYNHSGTAHSPWHVVQDTCVLGTSCSVTLTSTAVFTSSATYSCTAQDNTAAAATQIVQSSGSAFAITGTGTDSITYLCVGY